MALDFPNSPSQGQIWVGNNGISYVYDNGKWRGYTLANITGQTDRLVAGEYNLVLETSGTVTAPGSINLPNNASLLRYSDTGLTLTTNIQTDTTGINFEEGINTTVYAAANVEIYANVANSLDNLWRFDKFGNLTLPTNTSRINYANGQSILEGITSGGGGSGNANITISPTAPVGTEGALWYHSIEGRLYVYDGAAWIDASPTEIAPVHDLIPTDDNTYSLGAIDAQWKDLFVSNATIYLGGVPLTVDANGTLLVNGNVVSGGGGGANLTNGSYTVSLDADGALNLPNNGVIRRNGAVNMVATNYSQLQWVDTGNINISDPNDTNGPNNWLYVESGGTFIENDTNALNGPTRSWHFDLDGKTTFPGDIIMSNSPGFAANNIKYGLGNIAVENDGGWTIGEWNGTTWGTEGIRINPGIEGYADINLPSNSTAGDNPVQISNYAAGNVRIYSYAHYWTFGRDGNLTLPSGATLGDAYGDGAVNTTLQSAPGGYAIIASNNLQQYIQVDDSTIYIGTDWPAHNYAWAFDKLGNITFPDTTVQTTAFNTDTLDTILAQHTSRVFGGNVSIQGNLFVNGNTTTINTSNYVVSDNIVQFADGNPADTLDVGFVAHRTVDNILQHTGLIRDASAGNWKLFSNVITQPGNTVDFTGVIYDDLIVGNITSPTVDAINTNITQANIAMKGYVDSQSFYSNAKVDTYLSTATINTTGNITAAYVLGNISVTGNVTGTQPNVTLQAGAYTSVFNNQGNVTVPRLFANGNIQTTGYIFGNGAFLTGIVTSGGGGSYGNTDVAAYLETYTGNISVGNVVFSSNASTISLKNGATIYADTTNRIGSIILQPAASGTFPGVLIGGAGRLLAPNGSVHQIFNASDVTFQVAVKAVATAATSTTTGGIQAAGGIGVVGSAYIGGSLVREGAISAAAWGSSGVGLKLPAASYTDTSSSGTQGTLTAIHAINGPTIAASSATTYTNLATLYIGNAPALGTNASATNRYALYVNQGAYFASTTTSNSTTTGGLIVAGGVGVAGNINAGGNITAAYFIGDGSQLTGLSSSYSNVQVATYLPTYSGNIANVTLGPSGVLTFADGTTQTTAGGSSYSNVQVSTYLAATQITVANIKLGASGNIVFPDGTVLTTATGSSYSNVQVATYLPTYTGAIGASNILVTSANITIANIQAVTAATSVTTGALVVRGGVGVIGAVVAGTLNSTGNVLAGTVGATTINATTVNATGNVLASNISGTLLTASQTNITSVGILSNLSVAGTITVLGNVSVSNFIGTNPNVQIIANTSVTTFDIYGNVTFPGNISVGGLGVTMPTRPAMRVYGINGQIDQRSANVNLKSPATTVQFNQGSYYNNTTGIFTAPVAGIYSVGLNARVGSNNGLNQIAVLKNGQTGTGNVVCWWEADTNAGTATHFGVNGTIVLAVGEWLSANIIGGNIQFDNQDNWHVTYLG